MRAEPDSRTALTLQPRGLGLGLLGVAIFALTLPMTRLATGTPETPQLSGLYIAAGLQRQHPSMGFWLCALAGAALVVLYAVLRSGCAGLSLHPADGLLLLGMLCAAVGYGYGARLAQRLPAEQVIRWALLLALPVTLPLTLRTWPQAPVAATAWGGFAYVAIFSMWLGFFAWYRGLAQGGTVRVSQLQLLQPLLSMLFAVPLLGESLDALTLGFALTVIAIVYTGRTMPAHTARPPESERASTS